MLLAPCVSRATVPPSHEETEPIDTASVTRRELQAILRDEQIRGQLKRQERRLDSMAMADGELQMRNQRFYDSLQAKSLRRRWSKLFYDMFIVDPTQPADGQVIDESKEILPFEGCRIDRITLLRGNIYAEKEAEDNRLRRLANTTHAVTREAVIRRDLLFEVGDTIDDQLIMRNKQLLRSRSYISDVDIRVVPVRGVPDAVEVVVATRDRWTITADAALASEGRTMVALYDANIGGTGTMLKLKTNFDRRDFSYGGNMVEYVMPNAFGTFFTGRFEAGRDFYNSTLDIGLSREFIKSTDFELGATYTSLKQKRYMIESDTSILMKERNLDLWGGYSRYHPAIAASIYATGHLNTRRYDFRPEVGRELNPALHKRDILLAGLGVYREKFLTANMICGFGQREYMAEGYRVEVVGGYSWGEFGNDIYLGMSYRQGAFRDFGYLAGGFRAGSYIDEVSGEWHHAVIDVNAGWFSNIIPIRRSHVRQFLEFHYTQGLGRTKGSDESIGFIDNKGLDVMDEHRIGTSRVVVNTETVLFTRFQPFGFRVALFGFADFGLLGYDTNPLRNSFFTSFGVGARLRNERLIFSTIQVRLGIAFGKGGLIDSRWFNISNGVGTTQYRYIPTRPEAIAFE